MFKQIVALTALVLAASAPSASAAIVLDQFNSKVLLTQLDNGTQNGTGTSPTILGGFADYRLQQTATAAGGTDTSRTSTFESSGGFASVSPGVRADAVATLRYDGSSGFAYVGTGLNLSLPNFTDLTFDYTTDASMIPVTVNVYDVSGALVAFSSQTLFNDNLTSIAVVFPRASFVGPQGGAAFNNPIGMFELVIDPPFGGDLNFTSSIILNSFATPEPTSIGLALSGLAALGGAWALRRRGRARAAR